MRLRYIGALALLLGFSACKLDEFQPIEGVEFEAEFAVPLLNSSITIQDILDRSDEDLTFLNIATDGSMSLSFEEEIRTLSGNEVMKALPQEVILPVFSNEESISLDFFEGVLPYSALFKSGSLSFDLRSLHEEDLEVTVSIPGLTKNGQMAQFTVNMIYNGSLPVSASSNIMDLNQYELTATDGNILIQYEAQNNSQENRSLDYVMGIGQNWDFSYITGQWSGANYDSNTDTLSLGIFENQIEGEILFSDPKLHLKLKNSFGINFQAGIAQLGIISTSGEKLMFESEISNTGFEVRAPDMNSMGQIMESTYTFDKTNSNIDELINAQPKDIFYTLGLEILNNGSSPPGYIMEDSQIDTYFEFELPLEGSAKGFSTESRVEIDLGEGTENLKEGELKLITANELPVDIGLQIYFLDTSGQTADSLFSSVTDVVLANAAPQTTYFELTQDRLDLVRSSKEIMVKSTFSSAGGGNTPVTINANQELSVKLGLKATIVE